MSIAPSSSCPYWLRAVVRALLWLELCALHACSPAVAPTAGPGDHVGDHCARSTDCGDGLSCHYGGSSASPQNVCRLEVGRCRFDRDCGAGTQQRCRRFGVPIGVCEHAL